MVYSGAPASSVDPRPWRDGTTLRSRGGAPGSGAVPMPRTTDSRADMALRPQVSPWLPPVRPRCPVGAPHASSASAMATLVPHAGSSAMFRYARWLYASTASTGPLLMSRSMRISSSCFAMPQIAATIHWHGVRLDNGSTAFRSHAARTAGGSFISPGFPEAGHLLVPPHVRRMCSRACPLRQSAHPVAARRLLRARQPRRSAHPR